MNNPWLRLKGLNSRLLAKVNMKQENSELALEYFEESLKIGEKLLARAPQNITYRKDLENIEKRIQTFHEHNG